MTPTVALATEDELSERVGERLLGKVGLSVDLRLRKDGFGYLKTNVEKFRTLAMQQPVLLLTDLDQTPCPSELLHRWLGRGERPENLVFRVVVREIEAWLLADRKAMTELLGDGAARRLPDRPEMVPDAKRILLDLARRAPRDVREQLVQPKGAIASQGLGYNSLLGKWVMTDWCPERAASNAPSLARARDALQRLAHRLTT